MKIYCDGVKHKGLGFKPPCMTQPIRSILLAFKEFKRWLDREEIERGSAKIERIGF